MVVRDCSEAPTRADEPGSSLRRSTVHSVYYPALDSKKPPGFLRAHASRQFSPHESFMCADPDGCDSKQTRMVSELASSSRTGSQQTFLSSAMSLCIYEGFELHTRL